MSDSPTVTLICPKCHGVMRSYERNGSTIDQCQECRGIFPDRGELERLIDAEQERDASTAMDQRRGRDEPIDQAGSEDGHHRDSNHAAKYGGKRRRGFLGELFD